MQEDVDKGSRTRRDQTYDRKGFQIAPKIDLKKELHPEHKIGLREGLNPKGKPIRDPVIEATLEANERDVLASKARRYEKRRQREEDLKKNLPR